MRRRLIMALLCGACLGFLAITPPAPPPVKVISAQGWHVYYPTVVPYAFPHR